MLNEFFLQMRTFIFKNYNLIFFRRSKVNCDHRFGTALFCSSSCVNRVADSLNTKLNMAETNTENLNNKFTIDTTPFTKVSEGQAEVLFPSTRDVFYNPVQEFNRDLSVAVIRQYLKLIPSMSKGCFVRRLKKVDFSQLEINVLEALSASGLRSIRYAKEVTGLTKVIANDMSLQAYESIKRNIKHNKVENVVEPKNEDAVLLMYGSKRKFAIVDLDPYGTAAPFLDSAVQSVVDGGLLMVTCTDMAILCGNGVEACHAKYGAVSSKMFCCHEMALRIVLQCIESHANRYGRYIEPLLCVSADFYVRIFVSIFTGPIHVKKSVSKLSMIYVCQGCQSHYLQPLGNEVKTQKGSKYSPSVGPPMNRICDICDSKFKMCGPIWSANMHNKDFVHGLLEDIIASENAYKTSKRMLGMLNVIEEELDDCPLFHRFEKLCSIVHVVSPTVIQFRSALLHAGHRVSMSHCVPTSIKTDAPQSVIWDVVREWAKMNAGKLTFEEELSKRIMKKESKTDVCFEERSDANPESRNAGLLRFQVNPTRYWGPKARSQTSLLSDQEIERQKKFQGKRKKKDSNDSNEIEEVKKHKLKLDSTSSEVILYKNNKKL